MKELLKLIARGFAAILILPALLLYKLECQFLDKRIAFSGYSQFFSLIPGLVGVYLRRAFYCQTIISCSADCYIGFGTIFSTPDISIAARVYIGNYCSIGEADIGSDTKIASQASLISGRKQHQGASDENFYSKVSIADNVWIGEGAIVSADVGSWSNIAAGAVLLKPIGSNLSAIGNPAKIVESASASV